MEEVMRGDALPISIICFGDSLTAGYQSPTHDIPYIHETPYGAFLQQRLGPQATVTSSGICGEVTTEMVQRFPRDVLGKAPNYVVILGGTNDLGSYTPPGEIFDRLRTLYSQAQSADIRPVAVTVPSIRMEADPAANQWVTEFVRQRQHLNRLIVDHCRREKLSCVDLFTATAERETGLLAMPYSNDGLHLTTAGYQKMADLLYDEVFRNYMLDQNETEAAG